MPTKQPLKAPLLGPQWRLNRSGRLTLCSNVPRNYRTYTGETVDISENAAKKEFAQQTGLSPQRPFAPRKDPGSGTFFKMIPKDSHKRILPRVSLFSHPVTVRHRSKRARITQCRQCWGFYNSLKCTRNCAAESVAARSMLEGTTRTANNPSPAAPTAWADTLQITQNAYSTQL